MAVAALLVLIYGFIFLQEFIYRRFWNKGLRYDVAFSQSTAFEGEKITINESLQNKKFLPLPWVLASYGISKNLEYLDAHGNEVIRGEKRRAMFIIGVNKSVSKKSRIKCAKRGYYRLKDAELQSNNILMTNPTPQRVDLDCSLTVYPRLVEIPDSVIPYKKMSGEVLAKRFINPDPFEFKGIREYQTFDSFKQINFKATARTGALMSNVFDYTVSQDITVLLNLQNYSPFRRDYVYEEAIRIAAFLCRYYITAGIPVGFTCPAPSVLTGDPAELKSGLSKLHLEVIYTALAHINLQAFIPPITDFMHDDILEGFNPEFIRERVYVLISSYHGPDLYEKYLALKARGARVLWIVPKCRRDPLDIVADGDIFEWEVPYAE